MHDITAIEILRRRDTRATKAAETIAQHAAATRSRECRVLSCLRSQAPVVSRRRWCSTTAASSAGAASTTSMSGRLPRKSLR